MCYYTFNQHQNMRKYTRAVKARNERSVVDYVLISKRNGGVIDEVRKRRGTEVYNEHYLLKTRIKMDSRRKTKSINITGEKQKIYLCVKPYKRREKK